VNLCYLTEALRLLRGVLTQRRDRAGRGRCASADRSDGREVRTGRTIAERARHSWLSRMVEALSRIISVEEDFRMSNGRSELDSTDLMNICLRMSAGHPSTCRTDRDLRELQESLRSIVHHLLACIGEVDGLSTSSAVERLQEICVTLPDV
uniref:Uncharacterized protein n=1 Tax=Denticeps clupeoides TaxID=299321 RepID=A0AAY4CQ19_9TELE